MSEAKNKKDAVFALRVPIEGDATLHVERRDGDPSLIPFVLVHGLASNLRLWDGVAEALHQRGHTVIALDQRGHGRSDRPDSLHDMNAAVGDLRTVIKAMEIDRPVLAGQSWGGNVVLEFGWLYPREVRGVVCVDGGIIELAEWFETWEACLAALTPPRLDHLTLAEIEARIRENNPELPDRAIAAALDCFRVREDGRIEPRLARERHLEILRSLWEHHPSTRFPTLETPAMLVLADSGDAARTERKRRAEEVARASAKRLRSHWFRPAYHDVHSQFPDRVAALLADAARDGFFQ